MFDDIKKNTFTKNEINALEHRVRKLPLLEHLSAEFKAYENGCVEVVLNEIHPIHLGGIEGKFINGPTLLSMIDCASVTPAMLHYRGAKCATIEITVRFMRPVGNHYFKVVGYVVEKRQRLAYVKAKVLDKNNAVLVSADGIISLVGKNNDI